MMRKNEVEIKQYNRNVLCTIDSIFPDKGYGFASTPTGHYVYFRIEEIKGVSDIKEKYGIWFEIMPCLKVYCDIIEGKKGLRAVRIEVKEPQIPKYQKDKEPDFSWYELCLPQKTDGEFKHILRVPSSSHFGRRNVHGIKMYNDNFTRRLYQEFDKKIFESICRRLQLHHHTHYEYGIAWEYVHSDRNANRNVECSETGGDYGGSLSKIYFEGEGDYELIYKLAESYLTWCKKNRTLPLDSIVHNFLAGSKEYRAENYIDSYYNVVTKYRPYMDILRYQ